MMIIRFLVSLLAIMIIVVGFVTMISPIPIGIVILAFGFLLLIVANPAARPMLKWLRSKWPWLNRNLSNAQDHAPGPISRPLSETEPD